VRVILMHLHWRHVRVFNNQHVSLVVIPLVEVVHVMNFLFS
jgi:hypothetical protein